MVGSSLKQLSERYGMRIYGGVAYGNVLGYAVTLSEDDGGVRLAVSTVFPDAGLQSRLEAYLQQMDLSGAFYIQSMAFGERFLLFRFQNTVGTVYKLDTFLSWFLPRLRQYGATDGGICTACGTPLNGEEQWKLIDGTAHCFHDACARRLRQSFRAAGKMPADSLFWGIVGAFLGALAGGFLWGAVLVWGYLVPMLGVFIGWLARLGYDLLHGKPGRCKTVSLILIAVGTVFLAYLTAVGVLMAQSGQQFGAVPGNIPKWVLTYALGSWKQFGRSFLELLPSMAFAIVGIFVRTSKNGADAKMMDLP